MLNKKLYEEIKEKLISECSYHIDYNRLNHIQYDDDIENLITKLKDDYINAFTESVFALNNQMAEEKRHSKQSEILGKLVMLVHEFKGFKGVQEVLHELFWIYQELLNDQLEKHEKRIADLETKVGDEKQ